ncbi:MAG: hypothetical protein SF028_11650 [Candidatus Sumerlaeia bacterium]|nr:hypothetical protein [Candidatus Sumerlaeia bacterium]
MAVVTFELDADNAAVLRALAEAEQASGRLARTSERLGTVSAQAGRVQVEALAGAARATGELSGATTQATRAARVHGEAVGQVSREAVAAARAEREAARARSQSEREATRAARDAARVRSQAIRGEAQQFRLSTVVMQGALREYLGEAGQVGSRTVQGIRGGSRAVDGLSGALGGAAVASRSLGGSFGMLAGKMLPPFAVLTATIGGARVALASFRDDLTLTAQEADNLRARTQQALTLGAGTVPAPLGGAPGAVPLAAGPLVGLAVERLGEVDQDAATRTTRDQRTALAAALVGADETLRRNPVRLLDLTAQTARASIGGQAITGQAGGDFARLSGQLAKSLPGLSGGDVVDLAARVQDEGITNADQFIRALQQGTAAGLDAEKLVPLAVGALKADQSGELLNRVVRLVSEPEESAFDPATRQIVKRTASGLSGSPAERLAALSARPELVGPEQAPALRAALRDAPADLFREVRARDVVGDRLESLRATSGGAFLIRRAEQEARADRALASRVDPSGPALDYELLRGEVEARLPSIRNPLMRGMVGRFDRMSLAVDETLGVDPVLAGSTLGTIRRSGIDPTAETQKVLARGGRDAEALAENTAALNALLGELRAMRTRGDGSPMTPPGPSAAGVESTLLAARR